MSIVYLFFAQLLLTGLMVICINLFGSVRRGYVTIDQLLSTTNFGYNLIYRILSPVIFISFATLALYYFKLQFLVNNLWIISVYYYIINIIALLLLRRFELVNKFLYFFIAISSISLAYWVYIVALQYGPKAILPDSSNFRTEWWFIVFGYFYSLLNDFSPNYAIESNRKIQFMSQRYKDLNKKYEKYLNNEFKNDYLLHLLFYSVMITEDINRPPFIRFIERTIFFTGKIRTTGIMQVTSSRALSDKESIIIAQDILFKSYKRYQKADVDEYKLVSDVANEYNPGGYGGEIPQNYLELKNIVDFKS